MDRPDNIWRIPQTYLDQSEEIKRLRDALVEIQELTHRRGLPITAEINDIATEALKQSQENKG